MKPEPVAGTVQQLADQNFRFRILALDTGHHAAAGVWGHDVGHQGLQVWISASCNISDAIALITGTATELPNCL